VHFCNGVGRSVLPSVLLVGVPQVANLIVLLNFVLLHQPKTIREAVKNYDLGQKGPAILRFIKNYSTMTLSM